MSENRRPILIDLGCGKDKYQNPEYEVFGIDLWSKSYEQLKIILSECFRILKDDGEMEIIVPHYSCISAYQDPTHRLFFTQRTFYKFGPFGFKPIHFTFHWFRRPYTGRFPIIINLMDKLINRLHAFERFFILIGGVYEMRCILKKDPTMLDTEHTDGAKILG